MKDTVCVMLRLMFENVEERRQRFGGNGKATFFKGCDYLPPMILHDVCQAYGASI